MSVYREPNPLNNPFPGGLGVLKKELLQSITAFFSIFEKEGQTKTCMSHLMNLHEKNLIKIAKELGGRFYIDIQELMQSSGDYANGHGKIEVVYECLEIIRDALKS